MKKFFICVLVGIISLPALAQLTASSKPAVSTPEGLVNWMTFEEAIEKNKTEKREIFIDVYTDWCGWCKVMDRNTFSDPLIAKLLNEQFYPVKFNAEQREEVNFNGHTFKFIPNGAKGTHELAYMLLRNQLSYPTVVFGSDNADLWIPIPGYKSPQDFHIFLLFFGDGHYKAVKSQAEFDKAWTDFQKAYKSPYGATAPGNN